MSCNAAARATLGAWHGAADITTATWKRWSYHFFVNFQFYFGGFLVSAQPAQPAQSINIKLVIMCFVLVPSTWQTLDVHFYGDCEDDLKSGFCHICEKTHDIDVPTSKEDSPDTCLH